jgi:putative chitinase
MGNRASAARYAELCPAFNAAMIQAGCTTERRATMWCAQLGHESGGLIYMEELASGAAYEWREDLGNTVAGDGRRYKGRGPIQVTGRGHYTALSKWAHGKGYVSTPTFFVDNPGELAEDRYAFLGAVWYWTVERNMNAYADNDDLIGATRAVNGGLTALEDRRAYWHRAGDAGAAILPTDPNTGGTPTMGVPELVHEQLTGHEGKGWPILGPSKLDPTRDNYLVEAVAEIRDGINLLVEALLTPRASLVEEQFLDGHPPAMLDVPTFTQTADYQAFHAARLSEETAKVVAELGTQLAGVIARLDNKAVTK